MQLFQSYHPYAHKVGERQLVLATELSHDQQHYVAHNKFYEQVHNLFMHLSTAECHVVHLNDTFLEQCT